MSHRKNDEKLKILQERLAQIKEKDTASDTRENIEKKTEITTDEMEAPQKEKKPMSFKWLKYFIVAFCIAFGAYYAYNKIDFNSLTPNKTDTKEIDKEIDLVEKSLEYNLDLKGDNIVITGTFEDESSAKVMVNDLNVKGFKADYFYLPNKSNNTEKVFKVFIGPYEHDEETNQWTENIEVDFEIIKL